MKDNFDFMADSKEEEIITAQDIGDMPNDILEPKVKREKTATSGSPKVKEKKTATSGGLNVITAKIKAEARKLAESSKGLDIAAFQKKYHIYVMNVDELLKG